MGKHHFVRHDFVRHDFVSAPELSFNRKSQIYKYPTLSTKLTCDTLPNLASVADASYDGILCWAILMHCIAELATNGVVNIRRAYGNWKSQALAGWEKVLHEFAIQPIQHFDLVKGKNATDMAMLVAYANQTSRTAVSGRRPRLGHCRRGG